MGEHKQKLIYILKELTWNSPTLQMNRLIIIDKKGARQLEYSFHARKVLSLHSLYAGWQATNTQGRLNWEYHNTWSPHTLFSGNRYLIKSSLTCALKPNCS